MQEAQRVATLVTLPGAGARGVFPFGPGADRARAAEGGQIDGLGGSLGIALMATLLVHFTQESRAVLATHLSWYDAATRLRLGQLTAAFVSRGADALSARSMAPVSRSVCSSELM